MCSDSRGAGEIFKETSIWLVSSVFLTPGWFLQLLKSVSLKSAGNTFLKEIEPLIISLFTSHLQSSTTCTGIRMIIISLLLTIQTDRVHARQGNARVMHTWFNNSVNWLIGLKRDFAFVKTFQSCSGNQNFEILSNETTFFHSEFSCTTDLLQGKTDIEVNNTFFIHKHTSVKMCRHESLPPTVYLHSSDVGYKQSQKLPVIYT